MIDLSAQRKPRNKSRRLLKQVLGEIASDLFLSSVTAEKKALLLQIVNSAILQKQKKLKVLYLLSGRRY